MLIIPAIDLRDAKVVRLLQGRYEEFTVYSHDPVVTAKEWQMEGASRLHIVDLDGAMAGKIKNLALIRQIIETVNISVQLGGGLRTVEDIVEAIKIGVQWVVLGTKACEDLGFTKEAVTEFGERIIVSVDVKFNKVATHGWTKTSNIKDVELINKLKAVGVSSFIYTDISCDGTLAGFNVSGIKKVLEQTGASIFYSGGISSMSDLTNLKELESQGLAGVIIGRALYEDNIYLFQAIKLMEGKQT